MRKITIEIEDLSGLISGLNNCLYVYHSIVLGSTFMGIEEENCPAGLLKMMDEKLGKNATSDEKFNFVKQRYELVKKLYEQLVEKEKKEEERK